MWCTVWVCAVTFAGSFLIVIVQFVVCSGKSKSSRRGGSTLTEATESESDTSINISASKEAQKGQGKRKVKDTSDFQMATMV
ncbi:hypothetical protein Q1695_014358 [Nippostrongylus brasiliensis]|nr:hypothetical protein Q1695_014358 [Nippostrongylus brasiliensis]